MAKEVASEGMTPLKNVRLFEAADDPRSVSKTILSPASDDKSLRVAFDEKRQLVVLTVLRNGEVADDFGVVEIPMTNVRSMRRYPKVKAKPEPVAAE
jgi:hypothetical protein